MLLSILSQIRAAAFALVMVVGLLVPGSAAAAEPARVPAGGAPPPGGGSFDLPWARVIDGDTFEPLLRGYRVGVGIIGIDAPSANTRCGARAAEKLGELLAGGAHLEEHRRLVFDERLRRMYHVSDPEGGSIARKMVRSGYAAPAGHGRERKKLDRVARRAKRNGRGCVWRDSARSSMWWGWQSTSGASSMPRTPTSFTPGFSAQTIVDGLDLPTAFETLPDGRVLIAEKSGVVRVVKDGSLLSSPLIDIGERVNDYWDRGLLTIAADPAFTTNGYVYLYYTYENDPNDYEGPKTARLTRVTVSGDTADPASEIVILGSQVGAGCGGFAEGTDCIPSEGPSHSAGDVRFAPDGTMFVTAGDGTDFNTVHDEALRAQDPDSLAGKLLRITTSGDGLSSNPFYNGDPDSARSKVWALGLRNAYRFTFRPGTSTPYVGDVGWSTWEEIDVVSPGANLGWPCYEGTARQAGYEPKQVCQDLYALGASAVSAPLAEYNHDGGSAAVTAGPFYTGATYPSEYRDAFFFGDYAQGFFRYLKVDSADALVQGARDLGTAAGAPVDIEMGPDGNLWFIDIVSAALRRIVYDPSGCAENSFTASYFSNRTLSGDPTLVRCESAIDHDWGRDAPDPSLPQDDFSVRWVGTFDFTAGDYTFTATADDGIRVWLDENLIIDAWQDQAATEYGSLQTITAGEHEIRVEYYEHAWDAVARMSWARNAVGDPPAPFIDSPTSDLTYRVGDVISFSGGANDTEDGRLSGASLDWDVILHHCPAGECHIHPYSETTGSGGNFTVPDHGDDSYFEIVLTATDSDGNSAQTSVVVRPQTVQVTLDTSPTGLDLVYDGLRVTAPLTRDSVVGSEHSVYAPSPQGSYEFESWSDGGAQQHSIVVGTSPIALTASFVDTGAGCAQNSFTASYYSNRTLSGDPTLVRCESAIDHDWGRDAPDPSLPQDDFSVRLVGTFDFTAGDYTFTATADDGIRVWLDQNLIIDAWQDQAATTFDQTISLTEGSHEIRVEYYEHAWDAVARLSWTKTGDAGCAHNSFTASYYSNRTLSGDPTLVRCESAIDHDWGRDAPDPSLPQDDFSVRWVGTFDFTAGDYTFTATADDGIRVWLDENLIIDAWQDQAATEYGSLQTITAGEHEIRVEYYEHAWDAVARMSWAASTT